MRRRLRLRSRVRVRRQDLHPEVPLVISGRQAQRGARGAALGHDDTEHVRALELGGTVLGEAIGANTPLVDAYRGLGAEERT